MTKHWNVRSVWFFVLILSQRDSVQTPTSITYYSPIYAWISQVVSSPQVSPPKPRIRLYSLPYALHSPPISLFSILSPEQYRVSTNH